MILEGDFSIDPTDPLDGSIDTIPGMLGNFGLPSLRYDPRLPSIADPILSDMVKSDPEGNIELSPWGKYPADGDSYDAIISGFCALMLR